MYLKYKAVRGWQEGYCGVPLSLLSATVAAAGQYHGEEKTSSY